MKPYQPTQIELTELGFQMLERGINGIQFNGIQTFVDDEKNYLVAKIELENNEVISIQNEFSSEKENLAQVEIKLADKIRMYFA
ncbi:hypothetical protein MY837_09255 [Haemophilus influenzae]